MIRDFVKKIAVNSHEFEMLQRDKDYYYMNSDIVYLNLKQIRLKIYLLHRLIDLCYEVEEPWSRGIDYKEHLISLTIEESDFLFQRFLPIADAIREKKIDFDSDSKLIDKIEEILKQL